MHFAVAAAEEGLINRVGGAEGTGRQGAMQQVRCQFPAGAPKRWEDVADLYLSVRNQTS